MRLSALFKKALCENLRDWKIIILGMTFAPFFVLIMYFYFGNAPKTYDVAFVDFDQGVFVEGKIFKASQFLFSELREAKNPDGSLTLEIEMMSDLQLAKRRLEEKSVDIILEIPEAFSKTLWEFKNG